MKVILLENVDNLGKKNEIKDVPAGFARNFLIPKGLVIVANEENIKKIEDEKQKDEEKAAKEERKAEAATEEVKPKQVQRVTTKLDRKPKGYSKSVEQLDQSKD